MKKTLAVCIVLLLAVGFCFAQGAAEETYPTKSINMTVPYGAGGTTDLTGRALANAMGQKMGTTINVVNTPGAGGSAGSLNVQNSKVDGYTLLANGMLAFTTMPINGYTDKTYRDWDIWIATFAPNAIIVPKNSPYKTFGDLVAAIRANPGKITAGTAGIGSGGHFGAEVVKAIAGAPYKHITYAGGGPALTATLAGEVDFCPQLLAEYKDLIISGDVRCLGTLSDGDIELAPGVVVKSIGKDYPEAAKFLPMGEVTGILLPKGLSEDKLAVLDDAFAFAVKDKAFLDFVKLKSFVAIPMGRAESQKYLDTFASKAAYLMFDAGAVAIDPAKFGFTR
ncbi:tripartite tricarboxylate transporter substrate binding protein [Sphaerochaeta sp. PS]|uniref:Bug family tripartite tricarboxylate transporter substrate binding protein n=1 Tax=Sphaerochaeta sp. PS TaxID=3076336 RepID=UPI0028A2E388|nr:tripartite tricarboxylate transporter substrate binding protein [Sphaerochaeta sp. PS]MDT4762131.1 tripartite tricarboxylate transporter substrate binding protein [Sphaerochaeta sp. PS]